MFVSQTVSSLSAATVKVLLVGLLVDDNP